MQNPAFKPKNSGRPTGAPQIPPLRFAPVGMTKGRVPLPFRFDAVDDDRRFFHYATPDFLLTLVALVYFMRLSPGNPGTFRSG